MRILGLVFAGTATNERIEMTEFVEQTLGLKRVEVGGVEADMFELLDGARFAVSGPRGLGETDRSIGFLVESLADAVAELECAGVEVDAPAENDQQRYVHFRAPDGRLYELVENLR